MDRRATTALAVAAAFALCVGATPGADFAEQEVFLTCPGPYKVQNANRLVLDTDNPSWAPAAPTGTMTGDDGCALTDFPFGEVPENAGEFNLVLDGTFTGNLDTVQVDLYVLDRLEAPGVLQVSVSVDGEPVVTAFNRGVVAAYRALNAVPDAPLLVGGYGHLRFGIEDIGVVDDPEGAGSIEHEIRIVIDPSFAWDAGLTWLLGAREVPAGLTFNADVSELPTPKQQRPDDRTDGRVR